MSRLQRIMEFAENLALDHKYDKELGHRLKAEPSRQGYHYTNAKKLNVLAEEEERPQARTSFHYSRFFTAASYAGAEFCDENVSKISCFY